MLIGGFGTHNIYALQKVLLEVDLKAFQYLHFLVIIGFASFLLSLVWMIFTIFGKLKSDIPQEICECQLTIGFFCVLVVEIVLVFHLIMHRSTIVNEVILKYDGHVEASHKYFGFEHILNAYQEEVRRIFLLNK